MIFYYIPGVIFFIYSLVIFIKMTNLSLEIRLRKIYYSLCILTYTWIIATFDLQFISSKGYLGISPKAWSIASFTIFYYIMLFLIENLILSNSSFKEFGFFGTKFIKSEQIATVTNQAEYINSLELGIEAVNKTVHFMSEYISNPTTTQQLNSGIYDYNDNFKVIMKYFFKERNLNCKIDIYTDVNKNVIFKSGGILEGLSSRTQKEVQKRVQEMQFTYIKLSEKNNVLVIPVTNNISSCTFAVIVKSNEEINEKDTYIVRNLLTAYEFTLVDYALRSVSN